MNRNLSLPLPFPPYARQAVARLRAGPPFSGWGASADGATTTLSILTGPRAWSTARHWLHHKRLLVVLPECGSAACYRWDWIYMASPPVLVQPCGEAPNIRLHTLAAELVRAGSARVLVMDGQGSLFIGEEEVGNG